MDLLSLPPDELRRLAHHAVDRWVDHLERLDSLPPLPALDPDWQPEALGACPDGPTDALVALDFLFDEVLVRGQLMNHPRLFARIPGPSNPLSVLADFAGTGINVFAGSSSGGAGATAVEVTVLEWLRDWMGMPEGSDGVLVTGGSVGTLTALAAAASTRSAEDRSQCTGYVSEHTHSAVTRAWRVLGFEPEHLRVVACDDRYRLAPAALEATVALDREFGLTPFWLVGTAGTTSTGSIDPLADLADVARREGLWLHVDGAYGAPARLTPGGRDALTGIERADSLVLDPHKWLFQPYEVGCVLVREPGLLERAFTLDGAYLRDTARDGVNFRNRGLQLTRSSRALKLWLSLRVFGLDAFRQAVARGIALAEHAEALLRARGGWEVVSPAQLAIVCFRRAGHDDDATDAMVRAVVADGYAVPSTTVLDGRVVARLCTINPRTGEDEILTTIERLEQLAG